MQEAYLIEAYFVRMVIGVTVTPNQRSVILGLNFMFGKSGRFIAITAALHGSLDTFRWWRLPPTVRQDAKPQFHNLVGKFEINGLSNVAE